jgi:hypothetical protein
MRQLAKLLNWILTSLGGLTVCIVMSSCVFFQLFDPYLNPKKYYREMNQIKAELNKIENVEVVNIWGHHDITLEEISARLRIEGKGEIVLNNLSSDVFNYPVRVPLTEIGGYTFTSFSHIGGIGSTIDIGTRGREGGIPIEKEFETVKDVVDNYDMIYEMVKNLKMAPEINHFETEKYESYLFVYKEKSTDQDPIFNLLGVGNLFEFAKTLKWNRKDSFWNRNQ